MKNKLFLIVIILSLFLVACSSNVDDGNAIENLDYKFAGEEQSFDVYFYIPQDGGVNGELIGCNDSISYITRTIYEGQDPLVDSISSLFNVQEDVYRPVGLENVFSQSDLELSDIVLNDDGKTIIYLSGDLVVNGVCDIPRIKEQLYRTINQFFKSNDDFQIMINGKELEAVLSLR